MPVTIRYEADSRLVFDGVVCDCGREHHQPTQDIYVGTDLIAKLPDFLKRRDIGKNCVMVCDENTLTVAGLAVEAALTGGGFSVTRCLLKRDGILDPDEVAVGEVLLTMDEHTDCLIAVGSGSITDTVRVNCARTGLPFVSVGTAPSMDGYTSVVAPLLLHHRKLHRKGPCPDILISDLDVLATAPFPMIQSGVGDVLGKFIARADWRIGSVINGEPFCPLASDMVMDAAHKLLDNIDEIKKKSPTGIRALIEGLLLSGASILLIGDTRAVASVEHNIAHYWEMMCLASGDRPPAHGASVGVATLMVWPLFQRFFDEDLSKIDFDALQKNRLSHKEREAFLIHAYGEETATHIIKENPHDFLTWEEQKRRVEAAQARFPEIQAILSEMPPLKAIENAMRSLDAPMTATDLNVPPAMEALSMRCAKDYRARYTLFKLLDECGLLEKYL